MLLWSRYLMVGLLIMTLSIIFMFVFLLRPFHPHNGYYFAKTLRFFGYKILGLDIQYRNLDQMEQARPCIFVGNHQHNLDLLLFGCTIPKGTLSIAKSSLALIPFFGQAYWLAGHFFIKRKKHSSAMDTMEKVRETLMRKKASLLIMPEGTRSHGKGLGEFKKGAFRLALATQLDICPIVVSSLDRSIDLNRWKAGTLIIEVLTPIKVGERTVKDLVPLMEETKNKMIAALHRLDQEIVNFDE